MPLVALGALFSSATNSQAGDGSAARMVLRLPGLIAPFKVSPRIVRPSSTINSTWNGGFGNWSVASDWTPVGSPNNSGGNTYNVTIDTGSDSVTLDTSPTINALTLGGSSGSSDLFTSSKTLTVTGALTVNASGGLFVQSNLTAGSLSNTGYVQIYSGTTLHLTNNGLTDIPAGSFLYVQGAFTAATQSGLAGLGSLEGNLELANGQTTTVTPATGTFAVSGSGSLIVNPGSAATTLTVNGNIANSGTVSDSSNLNATTLTNTGSFTVSSGGVVNLTTLNNTGTFAVNHGGTVNVTNPITDVPAGSTLDVYGSLSTGSQSTLNPLAGVEGTLYLGNGVAATVTPGGGTLTVAVSGTLFVDNPDTTTGTNLTVSGNLTNEGSTYAGYFGPGPNVLTVTGGLTNDSFANLYIRSDDTVNAATLTNSGSITVSSGGTLNVTGAGTSTNSKTITVDGTLALTGQGTFNLTSGSNITGGGGSAALTNAGTLEGAGTISDLGITNTGTILANQSTALVIQPSSTGLTNKGILNISAGDTLQIGTSAGGALTNFSGTTLTGGAYQVGGTLQFGSSGTTIATNAANITLSGAGARIIDFGGNNVLAGFGNNASTGVFKLASGASLTTTAGNFVNAGAFTVSTGSTFTIGGASFNFTQTSGATTVDGTLTSTSLGTVSVNGGSLFGNGTVSDNVVDAGVLSPGDSVSKPGRLTVADTYTQTSAGALDIAIGGATAGTKYDQLKITQGATLGGTLNIGLVSGFTPTVGETFTIVNAASVSGTFATVTGLSINGSEHFTIAYSGTKVVLKVVSGALTATVPGPSQVVRPGILPVAGRYGREIASKRFGQLPVAAPALAVHPVMEVRGFRAMDMVAPSLAPMAPAGWSPMAATAYNGMAAMNHMRFECGVDLKAVLKTHRRQWLKGLWADPDSPNALSLGYMVYTGTR